VKSSYREEAMFHRTPDGSGFLAGIGGGGAGLMGDGSGCRKNQVGPNRKHVINNEIKIAYQPEIPA